MLHCGHHYQCMRLVKKGHMLTDFFLFEVGVNVTNTVQVTRCCLLYYFTQIYIWSNISIYYNNAFLHYKSVDMSMSRKGKHIYLFNGTSCSPFKST